MEDRITYGGASLAPLITIGALAVTLGLFFQLADAAPEPTSVLERSEMSVGRSVDNYRLTNQDGEFVAFHSYKGKAALVSFMYTVCHGPCMILNHNIRELLEELSPATLERLATISISIDRVNDNPSRLRKYGLDFTDDFDKWSFNTTDELTLSSIVHDLGYEYKPAKEGFDHLNRLTLIGPDGRVARHFYGLKFDSAEVEAAILATLEGRTLSDRFSDSFISKVLLYCSNYDPVTRTYRIDYFFVVVSIIQYLLVMGTVIYLWRAKLSRFLSSLRVFHKTGRRTL